MEEPSAADKTRFDNALKSYLEEIEMKADWDTLQKLNHEELINNLVGALPISELDKQMLIEADTLADRLQAFTAILEGNSLMSVVKH